MRGQVRRREFISVFGCAAAWPLSGGAQQPTKTIGYLGASTRSAEAQWIAVLVQRLRELGWIEGRNVAIEYRWAEGSEEYFFQIATGLVQLKVDVIVTWGRLSPQSRPRHSFRSSLLHPATRSVLAWL